MNDQQPPRRRMFTNEHKKRSLGLWVVPLVLIVVVIIVLQRLS